MDRADFTMRVAPQCRVLVVDDDVHVTRAITRLLRRSGCRAATAASAEEALTILTRQGIDVLVSDLLMMPMTGVDLLRHAVQRHPEITSILLSGRPLPPDIKRAERRLLFQVFIEKPWDDAELLTAIQAAYDTTLKKRFWR